MGAVPPGGVAAGGRRMGEGDEPEPSWTRPPPSEDVAPSHKEPEPVQPPAEPGAGQTAEVTPAAPAAAPADGAAAPPRQEPAPAPAPPAAAATPAFEAFASRMGRSVDRVHMLFRLGAVLLLVASLILVAENALVFTSTVSFATGGGLDLASPSNASQANGTVGGIYASAGEFLSTLSFATTLDIMGFTLLGAAMVLLALGSQGIRMRMRYDGSDVPKSKLIPIGTGLAGACFFGWVALTTSWRTALTGSPTGDWSGIRELFDASGVISNAGSGGSIIPGPVEAMIDAFPSVTGMWMGATLLLIVGAIGILIAGAGFRRATGMRAGGVGFLIFSILAFVGIIVFIGAVSALFAAVELAFSSGGQGVEAAFASLAIAMVVKLLVVPFWAIVGFSMLALVGARFALLRPGTVLLAPADIKAIKRAQPAPDQSAAQPGAAAPPAPLVAEADMLPTDLGAAAVGADVVVEVPAAPKPPPDG